MLSPKLDSVAFPVLELSVDMWYPEYLYVSKYLSSTIAFIPIVVNKNS